MLILHELPMRHVKLNYLIDTNVISELRNQDRGHLKVRQWFSQVSFEQLFTSGLVIGELRKGVEQVRRRDATAAYHLEVWLKSLTEHFRERILIIDHLIDIRKSLNDRKCY